jgi:hypothetical protein
MIKTALETKPDSKHQRPPSSSNPSILAPYVYIPPENNQKMEGTKS